jgi:hypothetical protein
MSMHCKQCHESFPKNLPFDLFELRRHKYLPSDPQGLTQSSMLEDGGTFCSRKCLSDYLKVSDKSGLMELGSLKNKL